MPLFTKQLLKQIMYYDEDVYEKYKNYRLITVSTLYQDLAAGIGMSKNVGTRKNVKSAYQKLDERNAAIEREGGYLLYRLYQHAYKMCPNISEIYVKKALGNCPDPDDEYDMIIITRPGKRIAPNPSRSINYVEFNREKKLGKIVGFLIAQKGECKKYPLAYAVNLICTRESGIASLLIGAYMYAIRSNTVLTQKGLLELAGSFHNINAYCLYRKMGFVVDPDIFDPDIGGRYCLSDRDQMLPMSVDLSELSLPQILKMIASPSTNKEPLCDRRFTKINNLSIESGAKLNTLRDKVYNLEMIKYYFHRGFSRRRDYFRFFEYPIRNDKLLLLLIEIVREIQADQELMKSLSMKTALEALKKMIGWGTIYTLNQKKKYKTEFVFPKYEDEDDEDMQFKLIIDNLHDTFPRYSQNILLETLKEKIDKAFQEYTKEYDRLENGSPRESVVLEESDEESIKNKTLKSDLDIPKKRRTTVKSNSKKG